MHQFQYLPRSQCILKRCTAATQISLSAVVLGIALGQLVYGPMSRPIRTEASNPDRDRRIHGLRCCMCKRTKRRSVHFPAFLPRVFACSGVIVARAVIRDLFDREAGARLFALMMGIHGICAAIALASQRLDKGFRMAGCFLGIGRVRVPYRCSSFFGLATGNPPKIRQMFR